MATHDITTILRNEGVITHYQPIVSIKKKSLFAMEALSRGTFDGKNVHLPPNKLFDLARKNVDNRVSLDRLCRYKALENFKSLHAKHKEVLISINLDVGLLDSNAAGSNYLLKQTREWGVNPNNIIIEFIEANVRNTDALLKFVEAYRRFGFLIALDDVGAGHSNLERISLIKPDVIKLDRSLASSVHKEFHKQEVVRALVGLGRKIGSIVLAEGVEHEEEVLCLMELGLDLFQGYYFAKPALLDDVVNEIEQGIHRKLLFLAGQFKAHSLRSFTKKKKLFTSYNSVLDAIVASLRYADSENFDLQLVDFLAYNHDLECVYVLDDKGTQVSSTICCPFLIPENKRFVYQPAQKGADHSLKEYFIPLQTGLERYTTEMYISMASGSPCFTISSRFEGNDGKEYVVCVDVAQDR